MGQPARNLIHSSFLMNPLLKVMQDSKIMDVTMDQGSAGSPSPFSIINGSAAVQTSSIIHQANLPDIIEEPVGDENCNMMSKIKERERRAI